jgi:predicted esterase
MRLTILFLLISVCAFGQVEDNKVSPSGVKYIENFIDTSLVTVIYFHGAGQRGTDLNKLKSVAFYTKFYTTNKGRYNFFIPQQTTASWSWIYPIRPDGTPYGVEFIRWVYKQYGINPKKTILTGHSMGSPWVIAQVMPNELGGIAVVSGSGEYKGCVALGVSGMPVIAWHGESDKTDPNTFAAGYKACITWYQNTGRGTPIWKPLPGVGHGADVYAYANGQGLKEWIDELFPVTVPPTPVALDTVVFSYGKGDSIYFKLKSGKLIKK